jgi:hypothetical protein
MRKESLLPLLSAALVLTLPGLASSAEEKCGVCHPENRVAFATSIHAREGVGCASCHGGNPASVNVEAAHRGGFRSLTGRAEVPGLCAECHSDLEQMRPYNLPVDQHAVYQTSPHGKAVAKGDVRAAVCSDCHGDHEILSVADPRSTVHPRNLPATCGRCHGDEALMKGYGLDPKVVEAYRSSIHGHALLDEVNDAAPSCTNCHGVHGPTPAGVGDLDKVCGSCHVQTRRAFLEGPHSTGMVEAGLPECASCHSNHATTRLGLENLETLCAECHGDDSEQALLGRKLHALIEAAGVEVDKAEELALEAAQGPLHIEDHLSRIEEARTQLTESAPLVHAVSLEPVEQVTRRARSIGEEVRHELYAKMDRRPARLGLVLFWFYLLMTLAVLFVYKRSLRRGTGS